MSFVYESHVKELLRDSDISGCSEFELTLQIVSFIYTERIFFKKAFASSGQNSFPNFYCQYTLDVWLDRAKKVLQSEVLPDDLRIMISGYILCMCNIVKDWVLNGMKQSPELISQICVDACPEKLRILQLKADNVR